MTPENVRFLLVSSEEHSDSLASFIPILEGAGYSFRTCGDYDSSYPLLSLGEFEVLCVLIKERGQESYDFLRDSIELLGGKPLFVLQDSWDDEAEQAFRALGAISVFRLQACTSLHIQEVTRLALEVRSAERGHSTSRVELANSYMQLHERQERLRRQRDALLKMVKQKFDLDSPLEESLFYLAGVSAETIGVEGVSIWLRDEKSDTFSLVVHHFGEEHGEFSPLKIHRSENLLFFEDLEREVSLTIKDIDLDSRVRAFRDDYLREKSVRAALFSPMYISGNLAGILVHEQQKFCREWYIEEQNYSASVADIMALTIEQWRVKETERRLRSREHEYRDKLERSNKELQEFASIISHDLQEPLYKVNAFGELLEMRSKDVLDEKALFYVDRMRNASQRMSGLINDLLAYSRVTSKAMPFEKVSLALVLKGVLSDLEYRIEMEKAQIDIGELPELEADATQMRQLMQNLVSNALKFHQEGTPPRIHVYGREIDTEWAEIVVKDSGLGIEEKNQERIFGVFQRLHSNLEFPGSGIGLAICRKIVYRHGGSISTHSELGKGTEFRVRIPFVQGSAGNY